MPSANESLNEQDETSLEIEERLSSTLEGEIPRNQEHHARVTTSAAHRSDSIALRNPEKHEESVSNVHRRMVPLMRFDPNTIRIHDKK